MPATPDTLTGLLIQETQDAIYSAMLALATTLGLPVTSWQPGDPTRSLFFLESSLIEALEEEVTGFVQSGFLDYATGTWLQVLAQEVFNVIVPPATFATTTTQVLTNAGGGIYEFAADGGDTHFSCSASGATYTNTTGGTLTGVGSVQVSPTVGPTITMTVVADQAGSASTAGESPRAPGRYPHEYRPCGRRRERRRARQSRPRRRQMDLGCGILLSKNLSECEERKKTKRDCHGFANIFVV